MGTMEALTDHVTKLCGIETLTLIRPKGMLRWCASTVKIWCDLIFSAKREGHDTTNGYQVSRKTSQHPLTVHMDLRVLCSLPTFNPEVLKLWGFGLRENFLENSRCEIPC